MNTFEYIKNNYKISSIIKNSEKYFAHIPINHIDNKETLEEHINLVIKYFEKINAEFDLEIIIDNIIKDIGENNFKIDNNIDINNFIKDLFFSTLFYHDFGKINQNFQRTKMNNPEFENIENSLDTTHSLLGTYLFIISKIKFLNKFTNDDNRNKFLLLILLFSSVIVNHHKSFLQTINDNYILNIDIEGLLKYLDNINEEYENSDIKSILNIIKNLNPILNNINIFNNINFDLYILLKLNYSLLTTCDYLATFHYLNKLDSPLEFELISDNLKNKINEKIKITKPYNQELFENYEKYRNLNIETLNEFSNENLNLLRQKLSSSIIEKLKNNNNKLFYLEAPTGSGKTNLSFIALNEIVKSNDIKKIFYVFPFTTLITQTYQELEKTFSLNSNELVELHSKTDLKENNDENYENEKVDYINLLFSNYPICVVSHIKFFDILKSNNKQSNYLLYSLANSLVIIDELQSYPPKEWDKIIFFISNYSKYLNIRFILMSATLPKIDAIRSIENVNSFTSLIPESFKYFTNSNFNKRVEFNFSLYKEGIITLEELKDVLFKKCEEYFKNNGHIKTVIEFMTKKAANEFNNKYKDKFKENGYDVLFLSGTILDSRRKEIIQIIKNDLTINRKLLLISTQVIEAGVDVDMDLGFKEMSILDSEEQLAGRVNRNAKKLKSVVYLFKLNDMSPVYKNDLRYQIGQELLNDNMNEYINLLNDKLFNKFYDSVIKRINGSINRDFINNFSYYLEKFNRLCFNDINKDFQIIKNNTVSIYVPLDLPIKKKITDYDIILFNEEEIRFFKNNNLLINDKVKGSDVWGLYEKIIKMQDIDFTKRMINIKKIQSLITKFSFSVFKYSSLFEDLKNVGGAIEKYGYYYLNNYNDVYDYENGINDEKFKDSRFI